MVTRRRSPTKLSVLSLAITFVLVQLAGAWHLARETHARCAEHGEWIDVRTADAPAVESAPAALPHGPSVLPAAPSGDHEHCTLVEASRVRAVAWDASPSTSLVGPLVLLAPIRVEDPLLVGIARYLLAPKQSPPC